MSGKTVLIAAIGDVGNEPEAIRQALESFGFLVCLKGIGRPKDLTDILGDAFPVGFDHLILSCHGEDGNIVMPALEEGAYLPEEPRGSFRAAEVGRYLRLRGKTIVSLGCTTGRAELCAVFSKDNAYIAPVDYVEGKAAVLFAIHLFYELAVGRPLPESVRRAKGIDEDTDLFILAG